MKKLIFKSAEGIIDVDDEKGIIKGFGSKFDNTDSDGDVIVKGAFKKTISEAGHRERIKYLYQHDLSRPIGIFTELNETNKGLEFVAKLAIESDEGRNAYALMKAGVLTENSVGFSTLQEDYDKKAGINYIKEVKLYEISAVTLAANPMALINEVKRKGSDLSVDQLINKYLNEQFDALYEMCKGNITDELASAVEFRIKSLKEIALREITEPVIDHSAEEARQKEINLNIIRNFTKTL